ncbi:hypothetical protein AMST5_02160 [freshwater sediment metagenome]|uniref:Peptidase M41 domain-containing protein n=1 Tax=freshwater sediment metagenome TaxID=556182 RepID=A0AA48M3B3_9ZZZZ
MPNKNSLPPPRERAEFLSAMAARRTRSRRDKFAGGRLWLARNFTEAALPCIGTDALALAQQAYDKGKAAIYLPTRLAAATHEAGHAIVATALGRRVIGMEVTQFDEGWHGITFYENGLKRLSPNQSQNTLLAGAAMAIAGFIAEKSFITDSDGETSASDRATFMAAIYCATGLCHGRAELLRESVIDFVTETLAANAATLNQLVAALDRHGTLSDEQDLRRLLAGVEKRVIRGL